MIAQRLSARLLPPVIDWLKLIGSLLKALGVGLVKFLTHAAADAPVIAGAAAIVWGVHFFGLPVPIGTPLSWIIGGVLTIAFVAVSVKPLR